MSLNAASRKYTHTEMSVVEQETVKVEKLTTPNLIKTSCSRNQYECQASGDCIAIYNVCDGIPQCSDGSDEAIELSCPTEKLTLPSLQEVPQNVIVPVPEVFKHPVDIQRKIHPLTYENTLERPEDTQKSWQQLDHQAHISQQNGIHPSQEMTMTTPQLQNYGFSRNSIGWNNREPYDKSKEIYRSNKSQTNNEASHYKHEREPIYYLYVYVYVYFE